MSRFIEETYEWVGGLLFDAPSEHSDDESTQIGPTGERHALPKGQHPLGHRRMTGTVVVDIDGAVATLTLNRPDRRNAISWQLVTDLVDALEACRRMPLRAVVLTGAGGDFCVGADMARVGSTDSQDQETRTLRGRSREDDVERLTFASRATELLLSSPVPTIAAIDGACAGAGLSLALATDLRVAADRAVFNTAFVTAGVSGDLGSAWLLSRAVGDARARSLMLDPGRLDAHRAAAWGLVTEVSHDLPARIAELAHTIATRAPLAVAHARNNLDDAHRRPFPDYVRQEITRMVECAQSKDARRAAQAYIDKTVPVFTGD